MRRHFYLLAGLLALSLPYRVDAQEQPPAAPAAPASPVEAATFVDYRVGPADELLVQVFGLDQLNQQLRVSNSGKIRVPHLGIVTVNNLTTSEISKEISRRLKEEGIVKDPWVQVTVKQYRAHPVYLLGETWTPGQFMITSNMTVLDLLTLGNGTSADTTNGFLYRRKLKEDGTPMEGADPGDEPVPTDEAIPIDFRAVIEGRQANLTLRGGDVLYVPLRKPEQFYVVGAVLRPGKQEIAPRRPLLVSQAIAMAGGLDKTAKSSQGMLLRTENGVRQEIRVDVTAILKGKEKDFPVQRDDIIYIPGSLTKGFGYGVLNVAPLALTTLIIP
jgi:polysaccharide biosynthesis/export protein